MFTTKEFGKENKEPPHFYTMRLKTLEFSILAWFSLINQKKNHKWDEDDVWWSWSNKWNKPKSFRQKKKSVKSGKWRENLKQMKYINLKYEYIITSEALKSFSWLVDGRFCQMKKWKEEKNSRRVRRRVLEFMLHRAAVHQEAAAASPRQPWDSQVIAARQR